MFTKLSFVPQNAASLSLELHPHDSLAQFRFVKAQSEVRTFSSSEVALEEWRSLSNIGEVETVGDNIRVAVNGYHVYRVFN